MPKANPEQAKSPGRANPACDDAFASTKKCPHFGVCGGCTLQHLSEAAYRTHKRERLAKALTGLETEIREPLFLPPATRRRLAMTAKHRKSGPLLGFHARESDEVVNVQTCLIARPELIALLPALRTTLAGWLKKAEELDLALTLYPIGIDILITGPAPDLEVRETIAAFAHAHKLPRISWRREEREPSEPLILRETPILRFGDTIIAPPSGAFLQPSVEGEAALVNAVEEALKVAKGKIADLFAGLGTFGLRHQAMMVEGDGEAFKALAGVSKNAKRRDLFKDPLTPAELSEFGAIILDPPRAGAKAQSEQLARSKAPIIAYVSCNPQSFARDARTLIEGGYKLEWIQPVDQFIWSEHMELVARFIANPERANLRAKHA